MKKFFFVIFLIILLILIFNINNLRSSNFIGKENIKSSYLYLKKKTNEIKFNKCSINKGTQRQGTKIFIAGHTYGNPGDKNLSTYPKLIKHLKKNKNEYQYAFLAGDIVNKPSKINFLQVKNELNNFIENIYVAPGNHDLEDDKNNSSAKKDFLSVFKKKYQSLSVNGNKFILLDSTTKKGKISNDQINFLKKIINNSKKVENIFVISHHVIWQNYVRNKITSNVPKSLFKDDNFEEVLSIFNEIDEKINIYFIAGDIGVSYKKTVLFCEKNKNLNFIATGMGNKKLDNYLDLLISSEGKILSIRPVFF